MLRGQAPVLLRLALLFAPVCFTACLPRARLNTDCEWAKEPVRQLNLRSSTDSLHLSEDAQIAEELAIRYSDSFNSHGGCLRCGNGGPAPLTEVHRVREQCQMELSATVADTHGVTIDQVHQSLDHRDIRFDIAAVFFPMAFFLAFIAHMVASRVYEHVIDARSTAIMAIAIVFLLVASVILSAVNVPLGEIWSGFVEAFRVRNGHMGMRALRLPWAQHRLAIFLGGVALFWFVALFRCGVVWREKTRTPSR